MLQIVMVGGPSGVGKTRLIDRLLQQEAQFDRPRSYTTRPRRSDESNSEYEHLSEAEFDQLERSGAFITVDEVYGHRYAMAFKSLEDLTNSGKIPIKEIHPQHHAKLKRLLPGALSVVLMPEDVEQFWSKEQRCAIGLAEERVVRTDEDQEFYRNVGPQTHPIDVVLSVNTRESVDVLVDRFLQAVHEFTPASVDESDVERQNRCGYDLIADEFSDEKRITTANFHYLSAGFFRDEIALLALPGRSVLDLGTGRGHLVPVLEESGAHTFLVDLSSRMLSLIRCRADTVKICSPASNLPFPGETIDLVVSSLADPFLHTPAIREINRVLKAQGTWVFTSPSRVWSDALRNSSGIPQGMTRFVHSSGQEAEVYSFTYHDTELRELLTSCGYTVDRLVVAHGRQLAGQRISPALIQAAAQLRMEIDDLPILQMIVARKHL